MPPRDSAYSQCTFKWTTFALVWLVSCGGMVTSSTTDPAPGTGGSDHHGLGGASHSGGRAEAAIGGDAGQANGGAVAVVGGAPGMHGGASGRGGFGAGGGGAAGAQTGGGGGAGGAKVGIGGATAAGGAKVGIGGATAAGGARVGMGGATAAGGAKVGMGGATAAGGAIPRCVPGQSISCACASGESGAQTCLSDGTYGACVCNDGGSWAEVQLARLKRDIVGTWVGTQMNPWSSGCSATITFDADGHYAAHSPGEICIVFYYGTNDDSPQKTYEMVDFMANHEAWGQIQIYFSGGTINTGELRHIVLSEDGTELAFEFWKDGQYGPVSFSLAREP